MNDEQIAKIYSDGKTKSHTDGLRAVYEAGRTHDERERAAPSAAPAKPAPERKAAAKGKKKRARR